MQMPKRKAEDDVTEESEEEEIDDLDPSHQDSESSDFEDSGSSEEESDGSEDGSDGETFDSVQVDLDFAQPEEDDFLGIKTVLSNYLDGEEYDSSGLVDLVLKNVSKVFGGFHLPACEAVWKSALSGTSDHYLCYLRAHSAQSSDAMTMSSG